MFEDPRRQKQLENLIKKLGLSVNAQIDWSLLDLALTHPSISQTTNYQQLEFVGDAVVRLAAAEILLETYPDAQVGDFAAIRSMMVSDLTLAEIGESFGLERYLLIESNVARDKAGKTSRLADAFEAVLGALYLSTHNLSLIRPWLDEIFYLKAAEIARDPAKQNYKDALQEWTQARYKSLPEYRTEENSQATIEIDRFTAQVWIQDRCLGSGTGRTKKAAEQAAAKQAFYQLSSI